MNPFKILAIKAMVWYYKTAGKIILAAEACRRKNES